jgi:hypothetical protein
MSRPPKSLESFFAPCIPPDCREEVLGDLCEKYANPRQYFFLCVRTIPLVIVSRIRRTTPSRLLVTEPLVIYGAFLLEAWNRDAFSRADPDAFLRLAAPAALTWVYLLLVDGFATVPLKSSALNAAGLFIMCLIMEIGGSVTWMIGFFVSLAFVAVTRLLLESDPDPGPVWNLASPVGRAASHAAARLYHYKFPAVALYIAVAVLLHVLGVPWSSLSIFSLLLALVWLKRRGAKSNSPRDPV